MRHINKTDKPMWQKYIQVDEKELIYENWKEDFIEFGYGRD